MNRNELEADALDPEKPVEPTAIPAGIDTNTLADRWLLMLRDLARTLPVGDDALPA